MPISQRNQNVKKQYCKKFNKDRKKKKKAKEGGTDVFKSFLH